MSRIPTGLLYLTIYNPTLKPDAPVLNDDEDAEEQAHILFYTARERAVSRDKILRQVGLAKALVNFSGMFSAVDDCANVHSQARRMVMVSPEPDFWIHACVEVAKTPRPVATKSKGKAKAKEPPPQSEVVYDYHDGSIYDLAFKTHILRGYEQFKLTHGSFSSVLRSLGQEALELQLERFFTVWAWKWDLEDDLNFGDHLGVPLNPSHRSLTLLLDNFTRQHLPPNAVSFALIPPNVAPSSRLLSSKYPDVLLRHVLSKIPPPIAPSVNDSTDTTIVRPGASTPSGAPDGKHSERPKSVTNPFLNVDMRNLKWMFSGLTFGKSSSTKSTAAQTPAEPPSTPAPERQAAGTGESTPEIKVDDSGTSEEVTGVSTEIDTESLQDAISSENAHSPASHTASVHLPVSPSMEPALSLEDTTIKELDTETEEAEVDLADLDAVSSQEMVESPSEEVDHDNILTPSDRSRNPSPTDSPPILPEPPVFVKLSVHLPRSDIPSETERKRIYHASSGSTTFAFVISEDEDMDLPSIAEHAIELFADMQRCLEEQVAKTDAENLLPTVTSILERQSEHIVSTPPFTCSQPSFHSKSEHLFRGQEMLHSDLDVSEVFSRGQNPQHWHISRRGLGIGPSGEQLPGEVYLEVARKESTLTDVDNELAGVVKRFTP